MSGLGMSGKYECWKMSARRSVDKSIQMKKMPVISVAKSNTSWGCATDTPRHAKTAIIKT